MGCCVGGRVATGGEISKAVMVCPRTVRRFSGVLMMLSVLCSRMHVMVGFVRPNCKLVMMARQMGVFWTMWVMWSGLAMVR